jgi:hypothetical protein
MKNLLFGMFEKEKKAKFTTKTPPSIVVVAKLEDIAQLVVDLRL